jgi:glyoxylase-like metal-dependent hydrolase (beta-lactamase superfamily II)/ferredoxin
MADAKHHVAGSVEGDFFVDSSCINCGVSRHYAPKTFGDNGAHAFVKAQPSSQADTLAAQMALFSCPVAAIGTAQKQDLSRARRSFPHALTDGVFVNGYNDRASFGAHSYFMRGDKENWMVDAPRFTKHLADNIAAMGGLDYIFLSHRDDVSDAHKYAAFFGAKRIIHEFERAAQPDAEIILEGKDDHEIGSARIMFTPGHTEGHLVLLWRQSYLFVGDHFASSAYCWDSWDGQIESTRKLGVLTAVEWVFPGHGKWFEVAPDDFPNVIRKRVDKMVAER